MTTKPLLPLPKPCIYEGDDSPLYDSPKGYTADQMQAYAIQVRANLEAEVLRLREALQDVVDYDHDFCTLPDDLRDIARAALESKP